MRVLTAVVLQLCMCQGLSFCECSFPYDDASSVLSTACSGQDRVRRDRLTLAWIVSFTEA